MEILRYGPEVQVVSPHQLQQEVINRLQQTQLKYEQSKKIGAVSKIDTGVW